MDKKLGNIIVVIPILFLIILFLGATAFFVFKDSFVKNSTETPNVQPKIVSDPTENWKTFTGTDSDGKNIYEIKVPKDWKEIEHSSNFYWTQSFETPDGSLFIISFYEINGQQNYLEISNDKTEIIKNNKYIIETIIRPFSGQPEDTIVYKNYPQIRSTFKFL